MEKIESRENRRLKHLRRVREGKERNEIFIEGLRLADEAVQSAIEIREAFISQSLLASGRFRESCGKLRSGGTPIFEVADSIYSTITDTKNSQGIILTALRPGSAAERITENLLSQSGGLRIAVFLYQVSNPANLGAIVRTAEAAGAAGVIISKNSADAFSPKAIRGSMGSVFRVPVWQNVEPQAIREWAAKNGLRVAAADVNGDKSYWETDWLCPRLLVFGSEAWGLKEFNSESGVETIIVPIKNSVESLNLAVACGIILFEANRQFCTNRCD